MTQLARPPVRLNNRADAPPVNRLPNIQRAIVTAMLLPNPKRTMVDSIMMFARPNLIPGTGINVGMRFSTTDRASAKLVNTDSMQSLRVNPMFFINVHLRF